MIKPSLPMASMALGPAELTAKHLDFAAHGFGLGRHQRQSALARERLAPIHGELGALKLPQIGVQLRKVESQQP